jgi:hypothetical protein
MPSTYLRHKQQFPRWQRRDIMTYQRLALTIRDAVEASGIGRTTLYAEIRAGRLITHKVGRRTIILSNELEDFLKNLPIGDLRSSAGGRSRRG